VLCIIFICNHTIVDRRWLFHTHHPSVSGWLRGSQVLPALS